ncbi:hypothetical protein DKX38_009003 [Salix brachista]|uniref:Thioredoxin domain-containing protein n=1 Tax=Salix brachista TaxID=2182728 RepID=A0A5N5M9Y5_9ROSI|nr:hypothetical protein DKX38_009003 [Salix brachista]
MFTRAPTIPSQSIRVIDEFDQNIHFVETDIEEDPEIAEAAGIMGTPCAVLQEHGDDQDCVGGQNEERVQRIHPRK